MITISPVGIPTTALVANQLNVLATIKETLCNKCCVKSAIQPQYNITYNYSTPYLNGSTVFVPITAIVSIVTPDCCGCTKTKLYNEDFVVAFVGQTALPTAVTITPVGESGNGSNICCCMAGSYTINQALTITLS